MKINTGLPAHDLNAVGSAANAIEEQGFSGVSTQENRQDAFLPLAVAATHTTNLELRTSIAIAFARSPMVAANMSWDIQRALVCSGAAYVRIRSGLARHLGLLGQ